MKIYTITIAYCPAALLARSLILYRKYRTIEPTRHIVVQGHYPINERKNTNDIKLITQCFPEIELWDPETNLGSAQSQNWALRRLDIGEEDAFINVDPDSSCLIPGWDTAMKFVLQNDPNCALISCMAPMVQRYLAAKNEALIEKELEVINAKTEVNVARYGIPKTPTPFNLSMWRYSFVKRHGGIPQLGLWWGETEGAFWSQCQRAGKYHAYLSDFLENENGKFMQDRQQNEWKDLHCRTAPPNNFIGKFEEFLRWKYPTLAELDTCKDLDNHNHP